MNDECDKCTQCDTNRTIYASTVDAGDAWVICRCPTATYLHPKELDEATK